MHPSLNIGNHILPTYGTVVAIGFLYCIILAYAARPKWLKLKEFLNLTILTVIGSLCGGKILPAMQQPPGEAIHRIVHIWEPGAYSFISALVTTLILTLSYIKVRRIPLIDILDYATPIGVLGYAIQRALGCYMAGCCYGSPTQAWSGLQIPAGPASMAYPADLLHPTQLYYSLSALVVLLILKSIKKRPAGTLTVVGLGLIAVSYVLITFYRGDINPTPSLTQLTNSQKIAMLLCGSCLLGTLYISRRPWKAVALVALVVGSNSWASKTEIGLAGFSRQLSRTSMEALGVSYCIGFEENLLSMLNAEPNTIKIETSNLNAELTIPSEVTLASSEPVDEHTANKWFERLAEACEQKSLEGMLFGHLIENYENQTLYVCILLFKIAEYQAARGRGELYQPEHDFLEIPKDRLEPQEVNRQVRFALGNLVPSKDRTNTKKAKRTPAPKTGIQEPAQNLKAGTTAGTAKAMPSKLVSQANTNLLDQWATKATPTRTVSTPAQTQAVGKQAVTANLPGLPTTTAQAIAKATAVLIEMEDEEQALAMIVREGYFINLEPGYQALKGKYKTILAGALNRSGTRVRSRRDLTLEATKDILGTVISVRTTSTHQTNMGQTLALDWWPLTRKLSHDQADQAVASLNQSFHGGYKDWRLPSLQEILSLMDPAAFGKRTILPEPLQTLAVMQAGRLLSTTPARTKDSCNVTRWCLKLEPGKNSKKGRVLLDQVCDQTTGRAFAVRTQSL